MMTVMTVTSDDRHMRRHLDVNWAAIEVRP